MSLSPGLRLGPYEVVSRLGAGGMGEVYRARDTRLGRDVALKALPETWTRDADRRARLNREARLLASLSHPNVASLFGIEESDGAPVLVMELVPGPTLAERLQPGPLPVREALDVARQVAEGLESAHRKGIIHRDLKPANVKLTAEGRVKVLDFGLAKALAATAADDPQQEETASRGETATGAVVGTAAYMSPEQARGEELDERTDIWAFGCLLFECLTGRRAFPGATASDTLAAVLEHAPDWSVLPAGAPALVRSLLRLCLQKDRARRLQNITDARLQIEDALAAPVEAQQQEARSTQAGWRRVAPWALACALGVVALGLGIRRPAPTPSLQVKSFVIQPPTTAALLPGAGHVPVTFSASGSHLAYVGRLGDQSGIYLQPLGGFESRALEGTRGGEDPFFSPEGEWIGFAARQRLMKVALGGGPAVTICELPTTILGASWGSDGTILFGGVNIGLMRVPAGGGQPEPIAAVAREAGELDHHFPEILPGGRAALFTRHARDGSFRVEVLSLASGQRQVLIDPGFHARYVPTGHLVYGLSSNVFAVGFDIDSLKVTSRPVRVLESVANNPGDGTAMFSVAGDGSLAYVPETSRKGRLLVWVDRQGAERLLPLPPRAFATASLSPDGRRIAMTVEEEPGRSDIWLYDVIDDTQRRLTFEGSNEGPVWTPDGKTLTFSSSSAGPINLFSLPADGSGVAERLLKSDLHQWAGMWSPDGAHLAFTESDPTDIPKIRILSSGRNAEPQPFGDPDPPGKGIALARPGFSPDGRWIAYGARPEVYVAPFPGPGARRQISTDRGSAPRWSPDGRELFYRRRDQVLAVPIKAWTPLAFGKATVLFEGRYLGLGFYSTNYDVTRDGRFLMVKLSEEELAPQPIRVVLSWFDELKRRLPVN